MLLIGQRPAFLGEAGSAGQRFMRPGCQSQKLLRRLVAAGAVTLLAAAVCYLFVDIPVARRCQMLSMQTVLFYKKLTAVGHSTAWLIGSASIWAVCQFGIRNRRVAHRAAFVFFAIAVSGIAVNVIKFIFARTRPIELLTHDTFEFRFFDIGYEVNSFPSGHACTIGAVFMSFCIVLPRWKAVWVGLGLLLPVTRVLINSHFVSDVMVGLYLGVAITVFLRYISERFGFRLDAVSTPPALRPAVRLNPPSRS